MLKNDVGFHFVRRQKSKLIGDPFWKWKEGSEGMEERNAMVKDSGDWVRVTDARLPALMNRELFGLRTLFEQIYFFAVDESGLDI